MSPSNIPQYAGKKQGSPATPTSAIIRSEPHEPLISSHTTPSSGEITGEELLLGAIARTSADQDSADELSLLAQLLERTSDTQSFHEKLASEDLSEMERQCEEELTQDMVESFEAVPSDEVEKQSAGLKKHSFLTPTAHLEDSNNAYELLRQYSENRTVSLLNQAIELLSRTVEMLPETHHDKPALLNNLGTAYRLKFQRFGEIVDLDQAIKYQIKAVDFAPNTTIQKAKYLNSLGISLLNKFGCLGESFDLEDAIEYQKQALSMIPDICLDRQWILSSLASSYQSQFEFSKNVHDLDLAVTLQTQAFRMASDDHPDYSQLSRDLGRLHMLRFDCLGELDDISEAIRLHDRAVSTTPGSHKGKANRLNNLGSCYQARFEHLGEISDIDKAIDYILQATLSTPDDHPDKPKWLHNLGGAYNGRFERLADISDVDHAINRLTQAISLASSDHEHMPNFLNTLGNSYQCRFEHTGHLSDVEKAIDSHNKASGLTPDNHPEKFSFLNNLATSHLYRFQILEELVDIDEAIAAQSRSISYAPPNPTKHILLLNNLGNLHRRRYETQKDIADIQKAIEYLSKATGLAEDDYVEKPTVLTNLGEAYLVRLDHEYNETDHRHSMDAFRKAALLTKGAPSIRFSAACAWARQATILDGTSAALPAWETVIELLSYVAWIGATVQRRYQDISSTGNIVAEAVEAAIACDAYNLALEWLEEGRGIVWKQLLNFRNPLDDLRRVDAELADQIERTARALYQAGMAKSGSLKLLSQSLQDRENAAQKHRSQAEDWENLVTKARNTPGFNDFLRPKKSAELLGTVKNGPLVIINITKTSCHALVLKPASPDITVIPLSAFSYEKAINGQKNLTYMLQDVSTRSGQSRKLVMRPDLAGDTNSLEGLLATLWFDLIEPILDQLGCIVKTGSRDLPHLTWCTTGPLSSLPLHAAGVYTDETQDSKIFNHVISSYTPTIGALHNTLKTRPEKLGILAVGQEKTPGQPHLPGTKKELEYIKQRFSSLGYLQLSGDKATCSNVLESMGKYGWVHLACHASQNSGEPTESAFYLHGESLKLENIIEKSFQHAEFAFLSACQTASGDMAIPDEVVHLAAGMMFAGYSSVIATMWSIEDNDAPLVAERVYAHLLETGEPDSGKAAKALHLAVQSLRNEIGEKKFASWVPYIHIGQ